MPIFNGHDGPFPLPEYLCGAAGRLFRAGGADAGRFAPADQVEPPLAIHLGLDPDRLSSAEGTEILAGKRIPDGRTRSRWAYAGHQFGHFVPQLGDGRAILLGEVIDADGVRRDISLKVRARPLFAPGDGRAALGPVLREYIVSEAMAALGIPTRGRSPPS